MNKTQQSVARLAIALRLKPLNFHELFQQELTPLESVEVYLQAQLHLKEERTTQLRLKRSNLPLKKTLKEFDFGFQRSVSREQMLRLTDCSWIDEAYNIMFLGPPSVGKPCAARHWRRDETKGDARETFLFGIGTDTQVFA